jgi:hypothetical protein
MKKKDKKEIKIPGPVSFDDFLKGAGMRIANWIEGQKAQSGRCGD